MLNVRLPIAFMCLVAACAPGGESNEILIGTILPMTGPMSSEAQHAQNALQLAADEINASGQLGDMHLSLVVADDTLTAAGTQAALQWLMDEHRIQFVIGPATSASTQAIIPMINEANIIAMSPTSMAAGLAAQSTNLFRTVGSVENAIPTGLRVAKARLGFTRVAAIYNENDTFSLSSHTSVVNELSRYEEVTLVSEESYQGDPTDEAADYDLTAQLMRIVDASPDIIISSGLPEDHHAILIGLHALGSTDTPIYQTAFQIDEARKINAEVPGAADNVLSTTIWLASSNNARSQAFVSAYHQRYGEEPGEIAAQCYATLNILAKAMAKAEDFAVPSVRSALAATSAIETVLGPFSYDADGDAIYDPIVVQYVGDALAAVQ